MYIADMHCDSLSLVSAERGLLTKYNFSAQYPQLTFFAAFTKFEGRNLFERRALASRLANVFLYETERLGLRRILEAKDLINAIDERSGAVLFSIEGGGGLLADCDELYTLYKAGLRVVGPIWDDNELGCSALCDEDTGLTPEGRALIKALCELGITVDISHMSDKSARDTLEICPLPVIATHSNFRSICDKKRNLPDDIATEISARGGVIGLNLYPPHLSGESSANDGDLLRQVDYALEKLGEYTLGLGLDIDGTDGKYPVGFSEESSIHDRLAVLLQDRYGDRIASRIMGENVIDFLKGAL